MCRGRDTANNGSGPLLPILREGATAHIGTALLSAALLGVGRVLANPGGGCGDTIRISNFIVSGNQVSFGSFSGNIEPDRSLRMQAGPTFIEGQFIGIHFEGRFWRPGPACTYSLWLEPVS